MTFEKLTQLYECEAAERSERPIVASANEHMANVEFRGGIRKDIMKKKRTVRVGIAPTEPCIAIEVTQGVEVRFKRNKKEKPVRGVVRLKQHENDLLWRQRITRQQAEEFVTKALEFVEKVNTDIDEQDRLGYLMDENDGFVRCLSTNDEFPFFTDTDLPGGYVWFRWKRHQDQVSAVGSVA